jgi:ferredoxin-NADP reductase
VPAIPASGPRPANRPAPEPNATLVARVDLTSTVARFVVRADDEVAAFEPGQYFALGLTVDGRLLQRPYSTASPRGTTRDLEFLVRLVRDGAFTPRLWTLRAGDRLRMGRAKGLFLLLPGDPRTHLFIATGTGLAPFVSMIQSLVADDAASGTAGAAGQPGDVSRPRAVVVHGVSHVAELAYRDRLEEIAAGAARVRYEPVVSRPAHPANAGWTGLTGRIDAGLAGLCERHWLTAPDTVAYLCGNPAMIAAAERILADRGFDSTSILSEGYWPTS